jgi:hypothetical protein
MEYKIPSIVIISILAFILISAGIPTILENVLSQDEAITLAESVNDMMSGQNALQWGTNAILAFAQEDNTGVTQGQQGGGNTNGTIEDMLGGNTGMTDGKSGESGTDNGGQ